MTDESQLITRYRVHYHKDRNFPATGLPVEFPTEILLIHSWGIELKIPDHHCFIPWESIQSIKTVKVNKNSKDTNYVQDRQVGITNTETDDSRSKATGS